MYSRFCQVALLLAGVAAGQTPCPSTPVYSRCEMVFELNDAERAAHVNPYVSVNLQIEFRSPRHRTQLMPAFHDGGSRMVVRFAPIDPGEWEYRISSNLKRFDGKEGKFTATESDYPGFIIPANGHHWRYTEGRAAHLWMGDTYYAVGFTDDQTFRTWTDERAGQKFNHVRGYAIGREGFQSGKTFRDPDTPDTAFYKRLDDRVAYLNSKGITFDIIAGHGNNFLASTGINDN
ncbi:MAG: DUF5060 domain-containing protein [Bryobacteraceae bacterium]|nr:DUF5060 domain-containing protein [Bryobacteraceae bacterium]